MKTSFEWSNCRQLSIFKIVLAFLLPSSFAFFGFRFVLPFLVNSGYPKVLMWGLVASVMLLIFVIIGIFLNYSESKKLNISLFERLCIKKPTSKQWLLYLGIMLVGLILSLLVKPLIEPFMRITGLHIPDYMPFWLDTSINPMNTDVNVLSPGYPLKGNFIFLIVMAITLLLNILAEEIYFRAWLLPKMHSLGHWSWIVNGFLFALYHTFQLWLFPILFIVSITTSFVTFKSKSILPAFTIHIVANFVMAIAGILFLVIS
jgi:membrane protease YdiL (CAAX protease family)